MTKRNIDEVYDDILNINSLKFDIPLFNIDDKLEINNDDKLEINNNDKLEINNKSEIILNLNKEIYRLKKLIGKIQEDNEIYKKKLYQAYKIYDYQKNLVDTLLNII